MYHNLTPISTYGTCIMTYSLSLHRVHVSWLTPYLYIWYVYRAVDVAVTRAVSLAVSELIPRFVVDVPDVDTAIIPILL